MEMLRTRQDEREMVSWEGKSLYSRRQNAQVILFTRSIGLRILPNLL
jgi:hypothetical protein